MAKAKLVTDLDAQGSVMENARAIARVRVDEFYSWEQYVDSAYSVHELHNLRITAKRLRYTLELFANSFSDDVTSIIEEVTRVQDELGALHDHDVMIALLRLAMGALDGGTGYSAALTKLHQQKHAFVVNPQLLSSLLDPAASPSASQRQGLEALLCSLRQERGDLYSAFRQHWRELQENDFHGKVLSMLQ